MLHVNNKIYCLLSSILECSPPFLWVPSGMVSHRDIISHSCVFRWPLWLRYEWRRPSSLTCRQNSVTSTTGSAGFSIIVPWSILAVDLCCFNLLHAWKPGRACTSSATLSLWHLFSFLSLFLKSMVATKSPRKSYLELHVHVHEPSTCTCILGSISRRSVSPHFLPHVGRDTTGLTKWLETEPTLIFLLHDCIKFIIKLIILLRTLRQIICDKNSWKY